MRILLLSDLHANLAALEAATAEEFDRLICLGDLVGYGPSQNEVIGFYPIILDNPPNKKTSVEKPAWMKKG